MPLRNNFIFKLSGYHAKQKKLLKTLHGFTDSVIIARREKLAESANSDDSDPEERRKKSALIDILLKSTINGEPLSNTDIREEVDTFMFAGHDTTTSAIAFTLYNLAKHPEVQTKALEEIRNVIGDDPNTEIVLKDLNDLKYLEQVIKETLRLFPSVPIIGRKTKEETLISMCI